MKSSVKRNGLLRFFASVSAIALIAGSLGITAFAADKPLQEQIQSAANGAVIELTSNSSNAILVPAGKEVVLDLNGFQMTASEASAVITNNGTLTIKDSKGNGSITKNGANSDTFGIENNGSLIIAGGNIDISAGGEGIAYGIRNTGILSMSEGRIYALATGNKWAFGIFNTGRIQEISGGTVKGQIKNPANPHNALGISTEENAIIHTISGGNISAETDTTGVAYGIRNRGKIESILGGSIDGITTGTGWTFAIYNTNTGIISKITDALVSGRIRNSSNGNNALAISNEGMIQELAGGLYQAQVDGSGSAYGIRTDGTISLISGGAYKGNRTDNAIFRRDGQISYQGQYSLSPADPVSGFRYVMRESDFYVQLCDKRENLLISYVWNASGTLCAAYGTYKQERYSVYRGEEIMQYTLEDFANLNANTTYIAKTDAAEQPVYYFLGSSVTYGSANNGLSFADYLAERTNWTCIKKAVSGTTLVTSAGNSYIHRMKHEIGTAMQMDHLIVQLSTNDASQNKPLGKISSSKQKEDFNTTTIIGAMEYIIAYAAETWNCPVTFYTNPQYSSSNYRNMITALYELKEKWNIGIIDFYNYVNMDRLSSSQLRAYMADAIHPNASGYQWMAGVFQDYLTNYPNVPDSKDPNKNPEEQTALPSPTETPAPTKAPEIPGTQPPAVPSTGDFFNLPLSSLLFLSGMGILFMLVKRKKQRL